MFWKKKFSSHQTWIQDLQTPTDKTSLSYMLCKREQPNRNFTTEALTLILIWSTLLKTMLLQNAACKTAAHIPLMLLPILLSCCCPYHHKLLLAPIELQLIIPWDLPAATADLWLDYHQELVNGINHCTPWSRLKLLWSLITESFTLFRLFLKYENRKLFQYMLFIRLLRYIQYWSINFQFKLYRTEITFLSDVSASDQR